MAMCLTFAQGTFCKALKNIPTALSILPSETYKVMHTLQAHMRNKAWDYIQIYLIKYIQGIVIHKGLLKTQLDCWKQLEE